MGMIFDIMKFAIHDGPGIRTTVFFKGCGLNCWWCHNPESQSFQREPIYRVTRCARCGSCIEACEAKALSMVGGELVYTGDKCAVCGACVEACLRDAREIVGREVSVAEVMEEVRQDAVFYEESGGGVTFSGGEPLAQPDFLEGLLEACRAEGFHTAVDTSGDAEAAVIDRAARLADLFLYDLKVMDDARHRKMCGVSNRRILENLAELARRGAAVVVRVPLIPGLNDDSANLDALGAFVAGLPNPPAVDILPFEQVGLEKYGRLARKSPLPRIAAPSREEAAAAAAALAGFGLEVTVRGEAVWH